jgi:hypothetical protein
MNIIDRKRDKKVLRELADRYVDSL